MVEPIKITDEIRTEHQMRIDRCVERQNDRIRDMMKGGHHRCCFLLDKYDTDYAEVRAIYERAGYTIKPTGYIGGVWQLTEDICW